MTLHLGRVRDEDIATIADIERRSFSDPWSERSFRDVLAHSRMFFVCARGGTDRSAVERVLGYVVAWFAGGQGEIANLAVDPDARERGIGSALLDSALDEARSHKTDEVFLEVRSSNLRARQLYESRGFAEVGRRRRYYRQPVEDAVILRRTEAAIVNPHSKL
ncbi:MAG TPA: ribosomal protein S18-alanine N-acetyltransferase [Gemmatimonadaceae bacterium]|nr:ribosomal protein S18-alanine N-acetyltransferase [Gemmatimonadaceae bacterium]